MKNIFSLLATTKNELQTGIIQSRNQNGVSVKVGNNLINMPAATSESLPSGSKVIIGKAGGQSYVIGKSRANDSTIKEVRVNG